MIGGPISVGDQVSISGFELTATFVIAREVTVGGQTPPPPSPPPTPGPGGFNLTLDFVDNSLTFSQRAIVQSAADRWEQVVTGDIPDVSLPGTIPAGFCGSAFPAIPAGTVVDDILVQVSAASLISSPNQPGGVLAQAGPCGFSRAGSGIFSTARIAIDPTDIDSLEAGGDLFPVVLHEFGHTLGIGTNWDQFFVGNPIRFSGPQAVSEYNALGGFGNVPLQQPSGGHWDEPALANELMTPFITLGVGSNPLSRITVGALSDINFPGVSLNAADPYSLPGAITAQPDGDVRVLDMRRDAVLGPILDSDGNVVAPLIVFDD